LPAGDTLVSSNRTISLDHLIALNDEIAAMARAGIPLDRGLIELGCDVPGRLGQISRLLGEQMERGETLEQIMAADTGLFPPLYRAVVRAGIRSGRLSVALEGISQSARRVAELRRTIRLALIYPLFVAAIAYVFFVFLIDRWLPVVIAAQHEMEYSVGRWLRFLEILHDNPWWQLVVPSVVFVAVVLLWVRFSGSPSVESSGWLDFGRLRRLGSVATFSEVLTLLLGQNVPLEEALPLAGDASGNRHLRAATAEVSERLKRGENGSQAFRGATAIPPMLRWLLSTAPNQSRLVTSLRHMASSYRQQAFRLADWTSIYLPIWLTVGIGGGATMFFALSILGPWFHILWQIGLNP
jgi:general secretion pathway protein F